MTNDHDHVKTLTDVRELSVVFDVGTLQRVRRGAVPPICYGFLTLGCIEEIAG